MKSTFSTILLTAIITVILTSAVWIGVISAGFLYYNSEYFVGIPADFSVEIESPDQVDVGEEFSLVVNVSNPSEDKLTLGSIDIYDTLLDGFQVLEVSPKPSDRDSIFEFSSFYFSEALQSQESVAITFKLKGSKAGVWSGDIDCCTPFEQFVTTSKTIVVSPE